MTPLLTLAQVAETLGVSLPTLRRLVDAGELAVIQIGRGLRVHPRDLEDYLTRRRRPTVHERAIAARGAIVGLPRVTLDDDEARGRRLAKDMGLE